MHRVLPNSPRAPLLSILLALLSSLTARAAVAQDLPCEKYQLPNGLTVILHEDHSLPIVAVNLWYFVGSKDEADGRSGFAHLFEHLMFMGTERVPGSAFDQIMEAEGGSNNASTSTDRTNYFASGPAHLLPTLLWLEADRMEDLARTMNQEKLDLQREVVRNERRQTSENTPYGKAELMIPELMYPPRHPYKIPVIGSHADLEAATVADVKDFFASYYVPSNCSLVVAGDFDPAATKTLIESLFGSIARGARPLARGAHMPFLPGTLRHTAIDSVQLPRISFVYHSPAVYAEGDAELDLVAALLARGATSRLERRLVREEQTAVEVQAWQMSSQLSSLFQINVYAKPGSDLEAIERSVDEEIDRLAKQPAGAEELENKKIEIERALLASTQDLLERADRFNQYNHYLGEPNSFARDLTRYRAATPNTVREWAQKVFGPKGRLILRVLPEQPPRAKSGRDERPAPAATKSFLPPAPDIFKLSNGIEVTLWRRSGVPLVAMKAIWMGSRPIAGPEQAGLPQLCARMLSEGSGELEALAFSGALEKLGAEFRATASHESLLLDVQVLKRNFAEAARLAAGAAFEPRLAEQDWQRVHTMHIEEIKQYDDDPPSVAARVAARALFGDGTTYGLPLYGTPQGVAAISRDQLRTFAGSLGAPSLWRLLVAGDLTAEEAQTALEASFGARSAPALEIEAAASTLRPVESGIRVLLVHQPEAVQTVIRFAFPGIEIANEQRPLQRLVGTVLGGTFTSRLNQNLRERNGYTYGAGARTTMYAGTGFNSASSSVRADVTVAALREFLVELRNIGAGTITDEEVRKAREAIRSDLISSFARLDGILSEASPYLGAQLPFARLSEEVARMETLTAPDLNAAAAAAFPLERCVLVLVGDKEKILAQWKEIDLPAPTEVDDHGRALGKPL